MNDINYKITVIKLHYTGLEKQIFASTDVSVLIYGCGVSQYPQFYDQDLYNYQVLPRPYLGYFDSYPGENHKEKMDVRLGR